MAERASSARASAWTGPLMLLSSRRGRRKERFTGLPIRAPLSTLWSQHWNAGAVPVDAAIVLPHLTLLRPGPDTGLITEPANQLGVPLTVTAPAGAELSLRIEVELRDAVGYWHPTQRSMR